MDVFDFSALRVKLRRIIDELKTGGVSSGPFGTPSSARFTADQLTEIEGLCLELQQLNVLSAVPEIGSLTPATGNVSGGTAITIAGTGFAGAGYVANVVTIDGVQCTSAVTVDDATITCVSPAALVGAGNKNVVVTNQNGTDTKPLGWAHTGLAPDITSVDPATGSTAGAEAVIVNGTNFAQIGAGATTITFGGDAATGIVVLSNTQIACNTPAHAAGAVNVVVTNTYGTDTLVGGFTYA
jgi:hypothetical protein